MYYTIFKNNFKGFYKKNADFFRNFPKFSIFFGLFYFMPSKNNTNLAKTTYF